MHPLRSLRLALLITCTTLVMDAATAQQPLRLADAIRASAGNTRTADGAAKQSRWSPPQPVPLEETLEVARSEAPSSEIVTEMPLETNAVEVSAVCNCGQNHCHGVCRDPGHPKKPWLDKPGDIDRGDCPPLRYRMSDCKRAGNPHCVAHWAKCGISDKYSAWFVGGGAAFCFGRCRKPSEGTWGLDYDGLFGHANNWLKYTRGRKQGGEGAYETDGEPAFVSKTHAVLGLGH